MLQALDAATIRIAFPRRRRCGRRAVAEPRRPAAQGPAVQMTLIVPRMADWSSIESLKSFNETGIPQIVAMINRGWCPVQPTCSSSRRRCSWGRSEGPGGGLGVQAQL